MKNAKVEVIELDGGHNLADLLAHLAEKGITDFTRVRVEMNYSLLKTPMKWHPTKLPRPWRWMKPGEVVRKTDLYHHFDEAYSPPHDFMIGVNLITVRERICGAYDGYITKRKGK